MSTPANYEGVFAGVFATPEKCVPDFFYSCLAAHHVDYFGKVILTSPKLFALMR